MRLFFSTSLQASTVTTVRLCHCALDTFHLVSLLPTLTQCAALTHLDLSDNNVTAEGVEALVTALLPESRLRDLRLANNWFGPAGVYALTVVLEANMGLQHLDVSNKGVPPKDASRRDSDQHALRVLADALRVPCYIMYFLFVTLLFHCLLLCCS